MSNLLPLLAGLPLLIFFISLFVPPKQERALTGIVTGGLGINLLLTLLMCFYADWQFLDQKLLVLYHTEHFEFSIRVLFDKFSAVFTMLGAIIILLVSVFSRYYMHRDPGFRRFFSMLLLFYSAYNLLIISGNFETLFIGWEILGITSFLLIAFYRDRYLPVRNALKVLSYYRLGDICLILAMWMSHHLWHRNISFSELGNTGEVSNLFSQHYAGAMFVAVMILISAAVKSAQFPFSTWLPRAMEGPTSSSAIFYGSLASHLGVFLLLRTYDYWSHEILIKAGVFVTGLVTVIVAGGTGRVQSTVKTQIAYSSIAQIGLIFMEISQGWYTLALVHTCGNAFLRTWQLLVSPSVLNYLIHDMFFHFKPGPRLRTATLTDRLRNALYILNLREWNLDRLHYRFLWAPFKAVGHRLNFLRGRTGFLLSGLCLLAGIWLLQSKTALPEVVLRLSVLFYALSGALMVLYALAERESPVSVWIHAVASQLFITLSVMLNSEVPASQLIWYLSGSGVASVAGYFALRWLIVRESDVHLQRFHGHAYEYPRVAAVFLVCCLGVSGFPVSPTFVGIDLMFTHVDSGQIVLLLLLAVNFLFLELCLLRMYVRLFLGPHQKEYHEVAFRAS
jgi:NADH:ubiquinone oxidoreductase subunit 5 (subunit L)/multisubunit Na+/H+ antiporter MnhA subunit